MFISQNRIAGRSFSLTSCLWACALAACIVIVNAPAFGQPVMTTSKDAVTTSPVAGAHQHASSGSTGAGDAYSAMMQPMHTMHEEMSAAKSTGNPDKDFVILMVPHHQAAVDMAKAYLKHGRNEKLLKMAQTILDSQEVEIREMQAELKKMGGAGYPAETDTMTSAATSHH